MQKFRFKSKTGPLRQQRAGPHRSHSRRMMQSFTQVTLYHLRAAGAGEQMFSPAVFSAPIFLLRRRNNIHIQKADTMGKVTIRNCNTRKFDKNRKRKTQTGNTVLRRPLWTGNAGRRQNPDSTHSKAYDAGSLHPAVPGRRSSPPSGNLATVSKRERRSSYTGHFQILCPCDSS